MAYADTILAETALVAYWKLDEPSGTVADDAKGAADLTIAGSVTLGAAPLVPGSVAGYTFSNSALGRASRATSYPANDITIEGWFQATAPATLRQAIFHNGSQTTGFGLLLNTGTGDAGKLFINCIGQTSAATNYVPGTAVHHFVLTRGAVGQPLMLYIDGVLVATSTQVPVTPVSGFTVGAERPSGANPFIGTIDDVSLYSRAFTAFDVRAHYRAGGGTLPTSYASNQSGDWGDASTWEDGLIPGAAHTATIQAGHTVTVSDARTVDAWVQVGSGVLAIAGTGTLTALKTSTVGGDAVNTPKVTLAAGGRLLFNPGVGETAILQLGTANNLYTTIQARGTSGSRCVIGKTSGAAGTFKVDNVPTFIWAKGFVDAEDADFVGLGSASVKALDTLSLSSTGVNFRLYRCRIQGCGEWDVGNYGGSLDWVDSAWTGTLGTVSARTTGASAGTTATITRCDFDKKAYINGNFGGNTPGMMTLSDNIFRDQTYSTGWPAAKMTGSGNFFYTQSGVDNVLDGDQNNFYSFIRMSAPGSGNPHFFTGGTDFSDAVMEYHGPQDQDIGDCFLLTSGSMTIRRCILLPSLLPAKASGTFSYFGGGGTMTFEHCTGYVGEGYGVLFPHGSAMTAGKLIGRGNLFWSDGTGGGAIGTAFRNDRLVNVSTPAVDALAPAGATGNAFVGLGSKNNHVGGVLTPMVGFHDCQFSAAPTGNLERPAGGAAFVDETRDFVKWGRVVRGHAGTDDQVIDLAVADVMADKTLVRTSLLPWVRAGFAPTASALATSAHDGTTPGAVAYVPAEPPVSAYTLTLAGPETGLVGVPTGAITVTLGSGTVAAPISFTLAAIGAAGTFGGGSSTFALDQTTRSASRTYTPSAAGLITFSATDGGGLADPSAVTYTAEAIEEDLVDLDPARLAYWQSTIVQRHSTGTKPYLPGTGYNANEGEHYDVIKCMHNVRDYNIREGRTPTDWSVQIAAAIDRFRDQYILGDALGSVVPGHVTYTTGMVQHWRETGDPRDVQAIDQMRPYNNGYGDPTVPSKKAYYLSRNATPYYFRETLYRVKSYLDRRRVGLPKHPYQNIDLQSMFEFIDHYASPPNLRWGISFRPFYLGMAMRAFIDYWNFFHMEAVPDAEETAMRDQIPGKMKTMLDLLWATSWYPAGQPPNGIDTIGTWDKGSFKYTHPHRDDPSMANLTGFTVASVINAETFIGAGPLSSVNNFYRYALYGSSTTAAGAGRWVESYNGATKQFWVVGTSDPNPIVGQPFYLEIEDNDQGDQASPLINLLISHGYAWYYWYSKVVLDDEATGLIYRSRHDQCFNGAGQAWSQPFKQKEWNQSVLMTPQALLWREQADAGIDYRITEVEEPDPEPTYAIVGPATGDVGAASELFTITFGDEPVAAPITFTPHVTGTSGSFVPATRVLDQATRSGTFQFIPGSAGTAVLTVTNTGGLLDPPGISYVATTPGTTGLVEAFTWTNLGATGGPVGSPTGPLRVQYGPGSVPRYFRFTFHVAGVTGTFVNEDRTLNNTFRWGETQFVPTTAGTAVLTVTNDGGLPDPPAILYTATGDAVPVAAYTLALEGAPLGVVGVPTGAVRVTLGEGTVAAPISFQLTATGLPGDWGTSPSFELDASTRTAARTFTPSAAGFVTFSVINDGGLPNPAPVAYTAEPPPAPGTHVLMYTLESGAILLIPQGGGGAVEPPVEPPTGPAVYGGFPAIANLVAIAPRICISRTSGEVPLVVHAHAGDTQATFSDGGAAFQAAVGRPFDPYLDLEFSWDFGDGAGTETMTQPVTGATVDAATDQTGPEAVYVYRTAGAFTITLTARGWTGSAYITATTTTLVVDAYQVFRIGGTPTGGTYTLSFGGQTTPPIAFNENSQDVQAKLEALSTIGVGNVQCFGRPATNVADPLNIFFRRALGGIDQPLVVGNAAGMTGGTPVAYTYTWIAGATAAAVTAAAWSGTDAYFDPTYVGTSTGTIGQPYSTWAQLDTFLAGAGKRALLKRGTTLTATGGITLREGDTRIRVGAYGTGARPQITCNTGASIFTIESRFSDSAAPIDIVFQDLDLDCGLGGGRRVLFGTCSANGTQTQRRHLAGFVHLLDCALDGGGTETIGSEFEYGCTIYRCDFTTTGTTRMGIHPTGSRFHALVGCTFSGGGAAATRTLDHHIYPSVRTHALYRWISFAAALNRNYCINNNVTPLAGTSRGGNDASCHVVDGCRMAENRKGMDWSNTNNLPDDAWIDRIVIQGVDADLVDDGGSPGSFIFAYSPAHLVVRDCTIHGPNVRGIVIADSGGAPQVTTHQTIYRNFYWSATATKAWTLGSLGGGWVRHNGLGSEAVYSGGGIVSIDGSLAGWSCDHNTYWTPADATPFRDDDAAADLSWAAFRAKGLEASGTFGVDPGWADPEGGDFS